MESVANENRPPVEGHNVRSLSGDGGEGVVAKARMDVRGAVVGDEHQAVGEHVVGGASVCTY